MQLQRQVSQEEGDIVSGSYLRACFSQKHSANSSRAQGSNNASAEVSAQGFHASK